MSTITLPQPVEPEDLELISEDGEPLETAWHRDALVLLIEAVRYHRRDRTDFYVGGNMFIYYNKDRSRDRDFRGPDFFYVDGVPRKPERRCWVVWRENNRFPDVIVELMSESTAINDLTTKKDDYERIFKTKDYFAYDPDTEELLGWHLVDGRYQSLKPNEKGQLWCEELGLWLGTWFGPFQGEERLWLRFFDREGNLVPLFSEAQKKEAEQAKLQTEEAKEVARQERQHAKQERLNAKRAGLVAERERQRADQAAFQAKQAELLVEKEKHQTEQERRHAQQEQARAESEKQRADVERNRALAAEAELARLKALLAKTRGNAETS